MANERVHSRSKDRKIFFSGTAIFLDLEKEKNHLIPPTISELTVNKGLPPAAMSAKKDGVVTIPEVLENIFKYLDVDQLKICRFVCPAWNNEACRSLQRIAHVNLHEDSARSNDFQELVQNGKEIGMPSPFRRYYLSIDLFRDEILQEIVSNKNSHVVELYMNQSPSSNNSEYQQHFQGILAKNAATLKYLRLALKDGINLCLTNQEKTPLYLPSLKDFGFWECGRVISKSECIDFILEIINAAPNLQQLCSSTGNPKVLEKILRHAKLSQVENIYAESITGQHIRLLAELNMPRLKSLILQADVDELNDDQLVPSHELQRMVKNFSGSLEDLNLCWISSTFDCDFPHCPKLHTLNLDGWDGSLGVFDPFRLPSLKSVFITNHDEQEDSFFNPHDGVEKITIEVTRGVGPEGAYDDEEFDYLLLYASKQLPKVQYLDLTMSMTDETVRSIIRLFPQLDTLILDTTSNLSGHVFTGRNRIALEKFIAEGSNLREIDIMPSLRDLKCLRKLVLGRYLGSVYPEGFFLTNDMVRYGVAEMPALEEFQFNWNPELSIQIFRDHLCHLKKIIVNNSYEKEYQNQIRELFAIMPQVVLESNAL